MGHQEEEIAVTAYSGFRLNERPMHFKHQGKEFIVKTILETSVREFTPGSKRRYYFNVRCESGEEFTLLFDPLADRWYLS